MKLPLCGIRVHLSASVPDNETDVNKQAITSFVEKLTSAVLREGGVLMHGSHPSLVAPLRAAAEAFVRADGPRESLVLVRDQKYANSPDELAEIEAQRKYSTVQIIPSAPSDPTKSLVPMREWMAERSDVIVAVGGRHYDDNKYRAGIPVELEEALSRGRPGFVIGSFGGSTAGYLKDCADVYSRLKNGLTPDDNRSLAMLTDVNALIQRVLSQIQLLPLVRESVSRGRLFRILALDGGGLRGAFTAAVLAKWDEMLGVGGGNGIVKHFDLVAGTSTGAILAIGLGLGKTPREILDFYREEGPRIFPKNRELRHWIKSKHDAVTLEQTLKKVFGAKRLRESCCRLVLPTVRARNGVAEAIVTPHSPDRAGHQAILAVEAALASSAAPTYFDAVEVKDPISNATYIDGGVWANNPVLPAIAEAVRHLKIPLDRIDVLSVGTLGTEADFTKALGSGLAGWVRDSADLFFAAQESSAAIIADSLLTPSRHLRVNQQTSVSIKLDDTEALDEMAWRGANVGHDSFVAVRSRFLDGFYAQGWKG
jgi:uncharacterized protein